MTYDFLTPVLQLPQALNALEAAQAVAGDVEALEAAQILEPLETLQVVRGHVELCKLTAHVVEAAQADQAVAVQVEELQPTRFDPCESPRREAI